MITVLLDLMVAATKFFFDFVLIKNQNRRGYGDLVL